MIWLISDTHFGHTNIIKYAKRPFESIEEMDRTMIENWNNVIGETDTVYHLGDFAMGLTSEEYRDLVSKLNGEITLIKGNHDRVGKRKLLQYGFKDVITSLKLGNYILSHKPRRPEHLPDKNINIHGHIHNSDYPKYVKERERYVNISVEHFDYKPVKFCELIETL